MLSVACRRAVATASLLDANQSVDSDGGIRTRALLVVRRFVIIAQGAEIA